MTNSEKGNAAMQKISREQARRFLLAKNGLLGKHVFEGEDGVREYVRQAGCVQFDPVDVCGKSHELAFLARVKGFTREMLYSLLYEKRELIDFFDKNMCIMCVEDWPHLGFVREGLARQTRSREMVDPIAPQILALVHEKGHLSAKELDMKEKADWYWSASSLGRVALETLYFRGELVIHHKTGTIKSYALAQDCLPRELLEAPSPFANELQRQMWQVMRRIGAVGMLWNAPSDAWLGVDGLTAQKRSEVFAELERLGVIAPVQVEGISRPMYVLWEDLELLARCLEPLGGDKRARLLAPLDCMLWDRRLIAELFGFSYKWEIYTPEEQRHYGYYVLPVIRGERFVGRVEPVCDRKSDTLVVRRFWPENDVRLTNRCMWDVEDALDELRRFHGLGRLAFEPGWLQGV